MDLVFDKVKTYLGLNPLKMATYIIAYDLNSPNPDYGALYKAVQSLNVEEVRHYLDSAYFIKSSDENASTIKEKLAHSLDQEDRLIIMKVDTSEIQTIGLSKDADFWLRYTMK